MSAENTFQSLVARHRDVLTEAAKALRQQDAWSLNTPCVVVTPEGAQCVPVSAVGSFLKVDVFVDNDEIQRFISLSRELGSAEAALDAIINDLDEERADEFCRVYDSWRSSVREEGFGAISATDVSQFVVKSREAFPSEIGVIAQIKGDDGKIGVLTGCVNVDSLLC